MIRVRFLALLPFALLGGCSSAPTVPMVSEQDAQIFIAKIETPSFQPAADQVIVWKQADNKKEACKLFMGSTPDQKYWEWPETKITWDGQCKDGYAYGVGREFLDTRKGLMSTIGTYSGGEKEPFYEASTNFDKGELVVGDLKAKKVMAIQVQQSPMPFAMTSTIFNSAGTYDYAKIDYLGGPATAVIKSYRNGFVFRFFKVTDPGLPVDFTMEVLKDGRPVGYKIERLKNGALYGVSLLGQQPQQVGLPASLVNFYNAQYQDISQKLGETKPAYDQALVTIERYKRAICGKGDKVDYVDQEKYRLICSEDGDLTPYKDKIAQVLSEQKARQAQQATAAAAEADRQVRLAQANAQAQNNSMKELTQSVNAFSSSMNSYSQGMMNTIQQNNNQMMQYNQGFQAQPQTYDTNCVHVANVINCKTR
ncbi:hypothetical protein [Pseudomonas sp. PLMAX]|uniref:hypothetical protein n=1 Tax=Pseudomonas sp. PLMAX TaxID=2201998 RepID=UPI0038BCDD70